MRISIGFLLLGAMILSACTSNGSENGASAEESTLVNDSKAPERTTAAALEGYRYNIYEDKELPYANINRLSLAIEIKEYPIEEDRLLATLADIADKYKGKTNAIAIRVHWDRRESVPSFGVWAWAPEGDWAKAAEGDDTDWDNYQWENGSPVNKFANPDGCDLPAEEDLEVNQAFNEGSSRTDIEGEDKDRAIAAELGITQEEYGAAIARVSEWSHC